MPTSRLASLALLLERYVLSLFFLYYAFRQIGAIHSALETLPARTGMALYAVAFPELVKHVLLLLFDVLVGLLLLLGRSPAVPPQGVREVLVPLVGNFFYLAYNVAGLAPAALTVNRVPSPWQFPLSLVALHLGVLAFALATWAVVHLGRSFAILVSVREVVLRGPYRYVRHPIYLSYLLQMIGFVCAYGSVLVLCLVAAHLAVTVWRARLEEARLSEHSAEYREYMRQTGFLFPRWNRPRGLSSASA